ncbi:hypothetical protein L3X39_08335 [Sabulilitoribacter multivorans]|uniref:Uncharacterized protein n=1 Tax=Flaviramulus multivorans TaxID=1304750 RepID=A0ABS9IJ74_9FLAO|nr:hypothetical protein [Flaviramulus multivorans]MCF7560644.1 hypothetical protein [Flaviramulus multivorans]
MMEYGDTSDISLNDLKETCLILLSEYEPEEAAEIVLKYIFKNKLNQGQIGNISHEMQDEKMWEEYADLSFHEDFFNATQILYRAYNGKFPHPEAVQFKIKVSTNSIESLSVFKAKSEAALIRLLAKGMPPNTLINRLYQEELKGVEFEEAKDIIWQLQKVELESNSTEFTVISSSYWFKDLKYIEDFEASTHPDV